MENRGKEGNQIEARIWRYIVVWLARELVTPGVWYLLGL